MLDFMLALESLLKRWPDGVKMSVIQIAKETKTRTPHAMECLCDALNKSLDPHDPISFNEVNKAFAIIYDRSQDELKERQEAHFKKIDLAIKAYDTTMSKVSVMQCTKNWRGAYRTLDYFYGQKKEHLPPEQSITLCNECLRLGMKAQINFQEMSEWLKQGISILLKINSQSSIEHALDFLDAYGDYFTIQANNRGENYLSDIMMELKPSIMEFNLSNRLNEIAQQYNITSVADITL